MYFDSVCMKLWHFDTEHQNFSDHAGEPQIQTIFFLLVFIYIHLPCDIYVNSALYKHNLYNKFPWQSLWIIQLYFRKVPADCYTTKAFNCLKWQITKLFFFSSQKDII